MEIMKGYEPFSYEGKSDIGVLVSQGFTGSTSSVSYWGKKLAEAGFHIEGPRLTGHGTNWRDMDKIKYQDWIRDEEDALNKLKKRAGTIFCAGLSMGGSLMLYLAAKYPEIKGVILVNHAIELKNISIPFIPLLKYILPSVKAIGSDIKDPNEKEIAYDRTPTAGVYQMSLLLSKIRKVLGKIHQPVMMMKSKEDHVLPINNSIYTFDHLQCEQKELIWLENSYHVATTDFDKDIIVSKTIDFIKKYSV